MGNNGNLLAHYYHRFPPRPNWSVIFSGVTLILALLTIIWIALERITDLKIENARLRTENQILQNGTIITNQNKSNNYAR